LLQLRVVRFLPHIIDTVLLLAAVALTIIINQFPLVTHWVTVKQTLRDIHMETETATHND